MPKITTIQHSPEDDRDGGGEGRTIYTGGDSSDERS